VSVINYMILPVQTTIIFQRFDSFQVFITLTHSGFKTQLPS
jgi:hypothetical protein